jgi:hypothetical protein
MEHMLMQDAKEVMEEAITWYMRGKLMSDNPYPLDSWQYIAWNDGFAWANHHGNVDPVITLEIK